MVFGFFSLVLPNNCVEIVSFHPIPISQNFVLLIFVLCILQLHSIIHHTFVMFLLSSGDFSSLLFPSTAALLIKANTESTATSAPLRVLDLILISPSLPPFLP